MTTARTILAVVAGVATLATTALADSIDLRRSIRRLGSDQPILLRDVAALDGPNALVLAGLEIAGPDDLPANRVAVIGINEVRARLDAAGVAWSRVDLTGGDVRVRPAVAEPDSRKADPPPTFHAAETSSRPAPVGPSSWKSVAELLDGPQDGPHRTIAQLVLEDVLAGTNHTRLQLRIDDSDLAKVPADAVDCRIRLRGLGDADRVHAEISGRVADRSFVRLVSVETRTMRLVPIASRRISPRTPLKGVGVDFELQERPCLLSEPTIEPVALAGRKVLVSIAEGDRILSSMLVPEIVVEEGSLVTVRSRIGGFECLRQLEALESGAIGDLIPCVVPKSGRRGDQLSAVVIAPNLLELP